MLFDELKRHPGCLTFCSKCSTMTHTDSQGRTVDFKNTIIILTSNLGSSAILDGIDENGNITENMQQRRHAQTQFRPEFLNRLDEIVFYKPLTRNEIDKTVIAGADLNRRLSDKR
ncbi:MAG: AAA family ATPase [Christensenellales bacterium]